MGKSLEILVACVVVEVGGLGSSGCHENTAWTVREGFLLEVMPMLILRMHKFIQRREDWS